MLRRARAVSLLARDFGGGETEEARNVRYAIRTPSSRQKPSCPPRPRRPFQQVVGDLFNWTAHLYPSLTGLGRPKWSKPVGDATVHASSRVPDDVRLRLPEELCAMGERKTSPGPGIPGLPSTPGVCGLRVS
ncbi:hypothetical protein GWK47_045189 [Chionoecetes opilio]|uniref:Uncharacterized protein n=1 Tax=Chionoecetes opilio TaxID=41210 RepID=A0A8J4YIJ8_CHIOP|nr:hypothetical protein GWK47_045189 [Chionoecetes opilio]